MRSQDKSRAGRAVKADKHISKRGWPVPSQSTPGADWKAGTPGYVRQAADAAEKHATQSVRNFGGGKPEAARHRVPGAWTKGKPDVKRDAQFRNPVKQTSC